MKLVIVSILIMLFTIIFSVKLADFIKSRQDSQLINIGKNIYVAPNVLDRVEDLLNRR